MEEEIWKIIQEFPDYEVSNLGRVRSWRKYGKFRRDEPLYKQPSIHKIRGYYFISIRSQNGTYCRDIHRLVASAFLEPIEGKNTVDHINRNRLDNRVCNLRWATQTEQNINREKNQDFNIYKTYSNTLCVEINRYNKTIYQKNFKTLEEAKEARDKFLSSLKDDLSTLRTD